MKNNQNSKKGTNLKTTSQGRVNSCLSPSRINSRCNNSSLLPNSHVLKVQFRKLEIAPLAPPSQPMQPHPCLSTKLTAAESGHHLARPTYLKFGISQSQTPLLTSLNRFGLGNMKNGMQARMKTKQLIGHGPDMNT